MNSRNFDDLAKQGYKTAPVMRTILSDYDTPLSVYHKVAGLAQSYLFESVQGGDKWGRYSIIGLPCTKKLVVVDKQISIYEDDKLIEQQVADDPLAWIEAFQQRFKVVEDATLPAFSGGLVGYFGYDIIRYIEPRLQASTPKKDDIGVADIQLLISEELVVFDNLSGQLHVIVHANLSQSNAEEIAEARVSEIADMIRQPMPVLHDLPSAAKLEEADFKSALVRSI